jgi:pimeloyl-ACP methyl ester carboxylesterase
MSNTIVLLHGSANGSYSWGAVQRGLASTGARILAPDMLGYGKSPAPSPAWSVHEEVDYLEHGLGLLDGESLHLVAHSLGAMFGLYLVRKLGARVSRLTLIDPVLVSVLREFDEADGTAEMELQYQRFMAALPDNTAAARTFVEHWSGAGMWEKIGDKARSMIAGLAPRIRLEMIAARTDVTRLRDIVPAPPKTTILVGERTLVAPRAVTRQLARAFEAPVVVVPEAAHMIPLTHPGAVVEHLRKADDTSGRLS